MIHILHKDVYNTRIESDEYVLVECDTIPFNLVEICDYILSKNAKPLLSIKYGCYSYIKTKKSELSDYEAGICIVSQYNNNFMNTFVFDDTELDLTKPIYINESKTIKDFIKHLDLTGVEYTDLNYEELSSRLDTIDVEAFDFKTDIVKSRNCEKSLERILSVCMRNIRNNGYGSEYMDRLQKELQQYSRYGLTNMIYDVYTYYRGWQHLLLRGSANNSLVLFLLGVSRIDPIMFDLPFERFVNSYKMYEEV